MATARWNHVPKPEARAGKRRDISVVRAARPYTASYEVEGDRLVLLSAWGSSSVPLPRKRDQASLDRRAAALFAAVLDGAPPP